MALYGQRRNTAFVVATPGMRALLAARPREQTGAQRPEPTQEERIAAGKRREETRKRKTLAGKRTYQPNK